MSLISTTLLTVVHSITNREIRVSVGFDIRKVTVLGFVNENCISYEPNSKTRTSISQDVLCFKLSCFKTMGFCSCKDLEESN